jgi:hypothetical protein
VLRGARYYATIEEEMFSVGAAPSLYNEDLTQLELELSSGAGSCSREFRESAGLVYGRIIAKRELGCTKKRDFNDKETAMNPLPGYD